jgi:uncharacterized protein YbaP (TraB family)
VAGPTMWVVERSGSQVFIFGETVGVGADDSWLTETIRAAFDDSREFWCEVADAQEIAQSPLLAQYGLSSEPLSRRLSDDERRRVRDAAHTMGLDPEALEGLRPWLAGQLLEHAHRAHIGLDAPAGVHEVLVRRARDAGKRIRAEVPDAEAALSFFAGLGDAVEVEYLMWTLDRVDSGAAGVDRQVAAWRVGDGSVVAQLVAEWQARYPHLHQRMLAERNRAWLPRIDAMLQEPGGVFILVGDSHLPGDEGVLALLARHQLQPRRATT